MVEQADVAIVGGGMVGSAAAYFLAAEKRFAGRIVLIERDTSYRDGSTARSAGGVRQQFSTPENITLSRFTLELFSADALAPLPVVPVHAKGVRGMIVAQTMRLPRRLGSNRRSLALCPGFPPSIPMTLFGDRVIPYIHDTFLERDPQTREEIREAVVHAGLKRVRPAVMTTATTLISPDSRTSRGVTASCAASGTAIPAATQAGIRRCRIAVQPGANTRMPTVANTDRPNP